MRGEYFDRDNACTEEDKEQHAAQTAEALELIATVLEGSAAQVAASSGGPEAPAADFIIPERHDPGAEEEVSPPIVPNECNA